MAFRSQVLFGRYEEDPSKLTLDGLILLNRQLHARVNI